MITPNRSSAFGGFLATRLDELILAFTLLTRIPMPPARAGDGDALARAVWAYPIVGAVVGGVGALVFTVVRTSQVPASPAAWIALAAMVLTGCFHEDGLADFWDGIGGGHTVDRKLEIMRDSRIGSYGAAALIMALGARASLMAALDDHGMATVACIVAAALGRVAIGGVLATLGPARPDGIAALAGKPPVRASLGALGVGLVIAMAVEPLAGAAALVAVAVVVLICRTLMQRQIGGYTGDGLGATEQKAEIAVLVVLLAMTQALSPGALP
jgi:adenosylcobinamide-GDP ribazoletransferase